MTTAPDETGQLYHIGWTVDVYCEKNQREITFEYRPQLKELGIRSGVFRSVTNDVFAMILQKLFENNGQEIDLSDDLTWEREEDLEKITKYLETYRHSLDRLRDFIDRVFQDNKLRYPDRNLIISRKKRGIVSDIYRINGKIEYLEVLGLVKEPAPDDPNNKFTYQDRRRNLRTTEIHIDELIGQLCQLFPRELEGFFFQDSAGKRYPFYDMTQDGHATPQFPLQVTDEPEAAPDRSRGQDSLLIQRIAEGRKLNNGKIYRLHKVQNGTWILGRTNYFSILDRCDFLREHIFSHWGFYFHLGKTEKDRRESQEYWLRSDAVVKEWLGLIREIRNGDFSGYAAGIAFNTPLFSSSNGQVSLVLAKESKAKATGGGKLHVCPAGMFEYFSLTDFDSVTWHEFQRYMAKELIEETMSGKLSAIEGWLAEELEGNWVDWRYPPNARDRALLDLPETGDPKMGRLEEVIYKVQQKLPEVKVSAEPLDKIMFMPSRYFSPICIVDAFRLRPEIIVPLHLNEQPKLFVNWEYEKQDDPEWEDSLVERFSSLEELQQKAAQDYMKWTEPGIAAMLLGGQRIFEEIVAPSDTDG